MANDFVTQMFAHLNSADYYTVRRSFGQTLDDCSIDALVSYAKMMQPDTPKWEQEIEFLVAGLCYNTEQPHSTEKKSRIPFEQALHLLYQSSSPSGQRNIEKFLKLTTTNTRYFNKNFASLSKRVTPYLGYSGLDYYRLIRDLKNWNSNSTRMKWAKAIVSGVDTAETNA